MYIISEIIGILAELYILHLFLQGSFDAQSRSPYLRIVAYGVFGILTAVFAFIPDASFVRLGLCCIGIVIVALYFFRTTIPQAIYSSIAFCALYVLTDVAMVGKLYGIISFGDLDCPVQCGGLNFNYTGHLPAYRDLPGLHTNTPSPAVNAFTQSRSGSSRSPPATSGSRRA